MTPRRFAAACALSTALTGCQWETQEAFTNVAWADDDSRVATVRLEWEQQRQASLLEGYQYRNWRYEVRTYAPDASDPVIVAGPHGGHVKDTFYYMASSGYLLYSMTSESDTTTERVMQVWLAGATEVEVFASTAPVEPCGAMTVVPSPDGGVLALIEKRLPAGAWAPPGPPPPMGQECDGHDLTLRFLDATSLVELSRDAWTVSGPIDLAWLPGPELVIVAGSEAWSITVGGPRTAVTAPDCMYPRTTSSFVSSDQRHLQLTHDPDEPFTHAPSNEPAWGECSASQP